MTKGLSPARLLGLLDRGIERVEGGVLALGVLLMALNSLANVVGRVVFGESLYFAEEVNRILIILITFAGLGYAARQGRHIRMTALYDLLPLPAQRVLMVIISLTTSCLMALLGYYALIYLQGVAASGRLLPTLSIPVYLIYIWVPIGFFVTAVQYLLTGIKNCTGEEVHLSTQVAQTRD